MRGVRSARTRAPARALPAPARSVVVSNVFGDDNRGGAAITSATVQAVRRAFPAARVSLLAVPAPDVPLERSHRHTLAAHPDVELLVAGGTARTGPLKGLRAVLRTLVWLLWPRSPSLPLSLQRVRSADLVVSKGGFVFVERNGWRGLLSLWVTAFPLTFAWRIGVPTVAFSTSIGPFRSRPSRWLNGFLLRRVTLVLPRDQRAYVAARDLGVPGSRLEQVPDSALGLEKPSHQDVEAAREHYADGQRYAVVAIRLTSDRDPLLDALVGTIRSTLASGGVSRILVVDQVSTDAAASARLVAAVADPRVRRVAGDHPPSALMAIYGGAEVVIACRLHAAIFSLAAGTPAVAVSIDGTKTEGVFEALGLGDAVLTREQATATGLTAAVSRVVLQSQEQRQAIRRAMIPAQAKARSLHSRLERAVQRG